MLYNFARDKSGTIAVMFSLTILLLLAVTGGALDYGAAITKKSRLQAAADAAALAAATVASDDLGEAKRVGEAVFKLNYPDYSATKFKVAANGDHVAMTIDATHATSLLQTIGIDKIPLTAFAEVPRLTAGEAEVVLVLDYSDSMLDSGKYIRLRDATFQLIDQLTDGGHNKKIKIGVVPFAAMVRVDLPGAYVRSDRPYNGCTQDRRAPYNAGEQAGHAGDDSKWGEMTSTHPCADMAAAGLDVIPLTDDFSTLKSRIGLMQPYLWTHIALGAEMGWQVIAPGGPFATGKPYDKKGLMKVFVLMTDGMQTAPGWGADGSQSVEHATQNLAAVCQGLKAKGVSVFTIGYDLNDAQTLDLLRTCAGPGNFYDAKDIQSGLVTSFQAIGTKVSDAMLRLSK